MKQWEYKILTFGKSHGCSNIVESTINEYGEMGWEMVSVIHESYKVTIFFKRELSK